MVGRSKILGEKVIEQYDDDGLIIAYAWNEQGEEFGQLHFYDVTSDL